MHVCVNTRVCICVCVRVCVRVRANKPREPEGGAQPPGRVLPDEQAAGARGGAQPPGRVLPDLCLSLSLSESVIECVSE